MRRASSWRHYQPGARAIAAPASTVSRRCAVRVLGIDPGSRLTGFGVIDTDSTGTRYVAAGAVRATAKEFTERLKEVFVGVSSIIHEYEPQEIAIERVFLARNPDSAIKLGQARGAALSATFASLASIHEYSAREVKQAVVGSGAAEKAQVQRMVRIMLGIKSAEPLGADAADALAIALCHAHGRALRARLAEVSGVSA